MAQATEKLNTRAIKIFTSSALRTSPSSSPRTYMSWIPFSRSSPGFRKKDFSPLINFRWPNWGLPSSPRIKRVSIPVVTKQQWTENSMAQSNFLLDLLNPIKRLIFFSTSLLHGNTWWVLSTLPFSLTCTVIYGEPSVLSGSTGPG